MKKDEKKIYSDEFMKDVSDFANFAIQKNKNDERITMIKKSEVLKKSDRSD